MKKITGSLVVCVAAASFGAVALLTNPGPTRAPTPVAAAAPAVPVTASDGGPVNSTGGGYGHSDGHGGTPGADSPAPAAAPATLTISGFAFSSPTVTAGATVTVRNTDQAPHTVTAEDGSFRVEVPAGGTATFTAPSRAGTFAYFCEFHPDMKGDLVVT